MGGAYGHLNHPFDDKNLTFGDFKTLIINTLQGNLSSEGAVTEKTDGQNIMISWKNFHVYIPPPREQVNLNGKQKI